MYFTSIALIAFIAAFLCFHGLALLPTFVPRVGPWIFYRLLLLRAILAPLSLIGILIVLWHSPSGFGWFWILLAILLLLLTALTRPPSGFFAVLLNPKHAGAKNTTLGDSTIIFGGVFNDEACAWPIEDMLIPRHIVNDTVDNHSVLVSFCAACRSALLYNAQLDGRRLTFEVAGVWRRNMIMRDNETKSLWQQATGECIMGPLKGKQLQLLPATQVRWAAWKEQHPQTQLAIDEQHGWFPPKKLLTKLLKFVTKRFALPGIHGMPDKRLLAHEEIAGIIVDGESRAYPLCILQQQPTMTDHIGNRTVILHYDSANDQITAKIQHQDGSTQSVAVDRQWWLGWSEFHPLTSIYQQNTVQ